MQKETKAVFKRSMDMKFKDSEGTLITICDDETLQLAWQSNNQKIYLFPTRVLSLNESRIFEGMLLPVSILTSSYLFVSNLYFSKVDSFLASGGDYLH
jgi:hypothetical protein